MLRIIRKGVIPLAVLWASFAAAQANGPFKHIIIIVQENRTPDNLFGVMPAKTNCSKENPFETGVDIVDGGYGYTIDTNGNTIGYGLICNKSLPLNGWDAALGEMVDPDHSYGGWTTNWNPAWGWTLDYDFRNMDKFCHPPLGENWQGTCPSYSFVPQSDVQPYFAIAEAYRFANYRSC